MEELGGDGMRGDAMGWEGREWEAPFSLALSGLTAIWLALPHVLPLPHGCALPPELALPPDLALPPNLALPLNQALPSFWLLVAIMLPARATSCSASPT